MIQYNLDAGGVLSIKEASNIQLLLAGVVSVGWIAVVLVPMVTGVEINTQVQIGVQAAFMLVLGAIFGISLVKRNGNDKEDQ